MTRRWVFVIALLAGCSFESAAPRETVDNRCGSDADCGTGACDGNICIDASRAPVQVAIEVLSTASESQRAAPASWAFTSERFVGPSQHDLRLPATRELRGTVRWDGLRVPAKIRFARRMSGEVAPLAPVPVEVDTLREAAGGQGAQSYDFSARLVAGETYDVVVLPTSDMVSSAMDASAPAIRSFPPLYLQTTLDAGSSTELARLDIEFPLSLDAPCASILSAGCTLEATIVSFDGQLESPEPGLQVRAIDQASGRVISSIGETDETGRFAIRIGDLSPSFLIRVTSKVGGEPFPSVSVDPLLVFDETPGENVIRIPRIAPVQFTGRVRDEQGSAVPSATVRFLSSGVFGGAQLGLQGSFSGSAKTNDDGSFGAELLPGLYAITVTPPEDVENGWGVLVAESLVGDEVPEPEPFVLPSRFSLLGAVRTFDQQAAAGVTVLARARASADLTALHRSQEAVADDDGLFAMQLDLGFYDVHVKTPAASGYPWLVEPGLRVVRDLDRGYELVPPVPIEGVVEASDGTRVPRATIRAYVLIEDEVASRLVQVAETSSDELGNYRLLIAPGLGAE